MKKELAQLWRATKGDGCTSVPDFHSDYTACCNRHDADYKTGTDENGKKITRGKADTRLFRCMRKNSKTIIGKWGISAVYFFGVRLFGRSHWKGNAQC